MTDTFVFDVTRLNTGPVDVPGGEVAPSCLPSRIYAVYRVTCQFRDQVLGPVPRNPRLLEYWLKNRAMGSEEAQRQLFVETLRYLGAPLPDHATEEQVRQATEMMATWLGCTFLRDERGLFLRSYHFKRCLREACSIRYAMDERWGPTRKSPLGYFAERVSIIDDRIYLGRREPDEVITRFPHVQTAQGSRDAITTFDAVNRATVTFHVRVMGDSIAPEVWESILEIAQEIGVGASRALEYGRFNVVAWECIQPAEIAFPHLRRPYKGVSP